MFYNHKGFKVEIFDYVMFKKKVYGTYREDNCPFCGKRGVTKNSQGVPVCLKHKDSMLNGLKCMCGEYLDVKEGKFGPYFHCLNCGNINFKKGMELNPQVMGSEDKKETSEEKESSTEPEKPKLNVQKPKKESVHVEAVAFEPKEKVITSDDVDLFY
tara:strand:+ start:83 stop:553 length:471 start_codon:yes stop_codon:yes gene_type:complete